MTLIVRIHADFFVEIYAVDFASVEHCFARQTIEPQIHTDCTDFCLHL